MEKFNIALVSFLVLLSSQSTAQKSKTFNQAIDVLNYSLSIKLNDSTDIIEAEAEIEIKLIENLKSFRLNLVSVNKRGNGMSVLEVYKNDKPVKFSHKNDILEIIVTQSSENTKHQYKIIYRGKPDDGLIIGKNIYGDRTFFGDNWPDRAKNWIPCIDHPSDKAKVEFNIELPSKYQVVANGKLINKTKISNNINLYTYKSEIPIPTKVMVFGAAQFVVKYQDTIVSIPISSWVYPQNKKIGFRKFDIAADALAFFTKKIGPYPFTKLANVQASTIFGGMENAGTIFYPERRVAGNRNIESTVVHEIAHQWFGNSATETDFAHIWLSEGFATYLTNTYMEYKQGKESTRQLLSYQRNRVINFYKRNQVPVVDTLNFDYMSLLNANSYQKGAWILHMLRKELGNDTFWQVLKEYYHQYKLANASSEDFFKVAEKVSGKELQTFFKQWLYQSGHPKLKFEWTQKNNNLEVKMWQIQKNGFNFIFPLDVKLVYEDDSFEIITLKIKKLIENKSFKTEKNLKIKDIVLDPDIWLLYEEN